MALILWNFAALDEARVWPSQGVWELTVEVEDLKGAVRRLHLQRSRWKDSTSSVIAVAADSID